MQERYDKYDHYLENYKNTVVKDKKHVDLRKDAIRQVENMNFSHTDKIPQSKGLARQVRDCLQKLMYMNPSDEEIKQLVKKAQNASETLSELWTKYEESKRK